MTHRRGRPHWITFAGKRQRLCQWSRELHKRQDIIRRRLVLGWSVRDALMRPVAAGGNHTKPPPSALHARKITAKGRTLTIAQWAASLGFPIR
jgi:hypothetical protein